MKPRASTRHAISPQLLLGMVVLALGGAAFLIPKEKELMARMANDHDEKRLLGLAGGAEVAQPQLSASERIQAALEVVFSKYDFSLLSPEDGAAVQQMLAGTDHPRECWKVVQPTGRLAAMPEDMRRATYEGLATQALAKADPILAGEIFRHSIEMEIEAPTGHLEKALKAFQFVKCEANTAASFRVLQVLEKRRAFSLEEQVLFCQLLREDGQPKVAYEKLRSLYDATTTLDKKVELFEELVGCINDADQDADLPVLTKQLLEKMPEYALSLEQLREQRGNWETPISKTLGPFAERAFEYAKYCAWGKVPQHEAAIEFFLKSAACGHREALRLVNDLTTDLSQESQFTRLLRLIHPVAGQPELGLKLARGEAQEGNYLAAEARYREYVKNFPNQVEVVYEHGCLLVELHRLPEAAETFAAAIKLAPLNLAYRTSQAEALLQSGQFQAALDCYRAVPEATHDQASLENFILLAEAEGDMKTAATVMRQLLERKKSPPAVDYKDLADVEMDAGSLGQAFHTLSAGLKQWPQSSILRCAVAELLLANKQYAETKKLLLDGDLKTDLRQATLYIEACSELEDRSALVALGSNPIDRPWSPDTIGPLAYLCELAGEPESAVKLLSKAAQSGSSTAVSALISSADETDSDSLRRLGDILNGLGEEKEAQAAWTKSLQLILARSQTESAEPTEADTESPSTESEAP